MALRHSGFPTWPSPNRQALVITGSPGVGKSAVLGRMVTTADLGLRSALPTSDDAIRATLGSIACAVHAKGKTALDVAKELARAASARIPDTLADLPTGIRDALQERRRTKFNVIIDALDEATSPAEARAIITKIILPLTETCSYLGVDVIVGTRRDDNEGPLLTLFSRAPQIDLDAPEYFQLDDLTDYTLACLQLTGDEREGNPYADTSVARPVADRIASLASRNFLVARLAAREHGLYDTQPLVPSDLAFGATVESALTEYLERVGPIGSLPAVDALTALAFAQTPGLPVELWQLVIESLYGQQISTPGLIRFARSMAASYILESNTDGSATPRFRLFHQALNDVLTSKRAQIFRHSDDQATLTETFVNFGRKMGWGNVPEYLLRSLPGHAADAGVIDDLLADNDYLLHADLPRLMLAAAGTTSARGEQIMQIMQLIGLTPQARLTRGNERAALFSVTQALESMPITYSTSRGYFARWADSQPRTGLAVLEGHQGGVNAVCAITVNGRQFLATGSSDRTVRIRRAAVRCSPPFLPVRQCSWPPSAGPPIWR